MGNFSISMKRWWKMAISHLKHSYLNWRANPCRRKMIAVFHRFFQHIFLNLAFLIFVWIQSNFSSAWHDNQLFFLFFFFFFRSHGSSTLGNDMCHRWPSRSKHHSSCENCFEKGSSFGSRVVHVISIQRKGMTQKCSIYVNKERVMVQRIVDTIFVSKKGLWLEGFQEMGNFRSTCHRASIKVISEYHDFGTCIFGHWRGLASLKL